MTAEPAPGLREATLRHLTSEFAMRRDSDLPERLFLDELACMEGVVRAIGALSEEEAAEWRRRLDRAQAHLAEPDADVRSRAMRHLRALARKVDAPDATDHDGVRLRAAVAALAGVGAIGSEDRTRWDQSAPRHVPPPEFLPSPNAAGPSFSDSAYRRSIAGPDRRIAGLRVTVVELYDHGFVVYWHLISDRLDDEEPDEDDADCCDSGPLLDIIVRDDLGTCYVARGGMHGWSGGERTDTGHNAFAPGVREEASYIEVSLGGAALRIDLA